MLGLQRARKIIGLIFVDALEENNFLNQVVEVRVCQTPLLKYGGNPKALPNKNTKNSVLVTTALPAERHLTPLRDMPPSNKPTNAFRATSLTNVLEFQDNENIAVKEWEEYSNDQAAPPQLICGVVFRVSRGGGVGGWEGGKGSIHSKKFYANVTAMMRPPSVGLSTHPAEFGRSPHWKNLLGRPTKTFTFQRHYLSHATISRVICNASEVTCRFEIRINLAWIFCSSMNLIGCQTKSKGSQSYVIEILILSRVSWPAKRRTHSPADQEIAWNLHAERTPLRWRCGRACQVRYINPHLKKEPSKNDLRVEDLEWLLTHVVGNQVSQEVFCTDWGQINAMAQSLYKKMPRDTLALPVISPRPGNKEDLYDLQNYCLARFKKGATASGWLKLGRSWSNVIDPPLETFVQTILAIRGACSCQPLASPDMAMTWQMCMQPRETPSLALTISHHHHHRRRAADCNGLRLGDRQNRPGGAGRASG